MGRLLLDVECWSDALAEARIEALLGALADSLIEILVKASEEEAPASPGTLIQP